MSTITREQVIDQLRTVMDPDFHKDLVSLDMIKDVKIEGPKVQLLIELTTPACPLKDQIGGDVDRAVKKVPGVAHVDIEWSSRVRSGRDIGKVLPGVKNIIAVGAGKGGVGKSTVAVLLAIGLRRSGASTGLIDADVYGPSVPMMMDLEGVQLGVEGGLVVPPESNGVKVMSIGLMIDRNQPLVWRGPKTHGLITHFIENVAWGELDYLVLDLPPGTGDVPLTLIQSVPLTGSVIVCTPQDVALLDARRAVRMFQQLNVPCLGIVENMSYYVCPGCGHRDELFSHGGAAREANALGVPFLGEIPLNSTFRKHCDEGTPGRLFESSDEAVRKALDKIVSNVAVQVSMRSILNSRGPSLSIE